MPLTRVASSPRQIASYVLGLPYNFKAEQLRALFAPYGGVHSVRIDDHRNASSRGIGVVVYSDRACGEDALAALNDTPQAGRKLRLRWDKKVG